MRRIRILRKKCGFGPKLGGAIASQSKSVKMTDLPADLLASFGEEHFLEHVTEHIARIGQKSPLYRLLRIDEERVLCREIERSRLQDPAAARYRRRAHLLACHLIDEKGALHKEDVENLLAIWEANGRIFYPSAASDEAAFRQVLNILRWLCNSTEAIKKILRFSLPVANHYLEHLIRVALFLPSNHVLVHADVRRAALSACFSFLRQNAGSCFATAPAILIHAQQPEYFLNDLEELLSTARLRRVVEGEEYSVPCSPSWGVSGLKKDLLSLSSKDIERSPGLFAALEAAQFGREKLKVLLSQIAEGKKKLYVDTFFEEAVLRENGLARERWELFKQGTRFISRSLLITQRDPQEALCESVENALNAARDMFRTMTDHPLLRGWEYTLASFSEVKMEFSRWNLYSSLGFDPNEQGGLGYALAGAIDSRIAAANKKIEEMHKSYELAFDQARMTEGMLKRASSEQEARRLSAEYQSRTHHMRSLLDMRNDAHRLGSHFVNLYSFLLKQFDKRFPEYFQEIYDAEMFDPSQGIDQDSAAGFRLVYKHGRSDPSQWTLIKNGREYIDVLLDFFKMIEPEIIAACTDEAVANEIPKLIDLVIEQLRSEEFLKSALLRMKKAHSTEKMPGNAPEMLLGEKLPWAYISGGTMETLLKTYYRGHSNISSEGRWVESAEDLLILLLETLKGVSFTASEAYRKNSDKRMLMHSPTHAFLLLPGTALFCEGWEHDSFTYTWVRDQLIEPSKKFYEKISLKIHEAELLMEHCGKGLPETFLHAWKGALGDSSSEIKISKLTSSAGPLLVDTLDAVLFCNLPIYRGKKWKEAVSHLIGDGINEIPAEILHDLTAIDLLRLAKGCFLLSHGSLEQRIDLHGKVLENALKEGMIAPRIVFADTNWPHYRFAFAWGAASNRLRLFRIEPDGETAIPMNSWEQYLNGSIHLPWAAYIKPEQYS